MPSHALAEGQRKPQAGDAVDDAHRFWATDVDRVEPGPWEKGGISEYQWNTGRRLAENAGHPYDSFGASVG